MYIDKWLIFLTLHKSFWTKKKYVKSGNLYHFPFFSSSFNILQLKLYRDSKSTYQTIIKCEDPYISSMVNVVPPHYGVGVVLDPDSCQSIATDLIVLVLSLYSSQNFDTLLNKLYLTFWWIYFTAEGMICPQTCA